MRARARGPLLKYVLHLRAGGLSAAAHLIFQWGWGRGLLLIIFQEKRFVSTLGGFFKSVNRILKIR